MTTPEPPIPTGSASPIATPAGIPSTDAIARLANAFFQALPDLPVAEAMAPAVIDLVPGVVTPPSTRPTTGGTYAPAGAPVPGSTPGPVPDSGGGTRPAPGSTATPRSSPSTLTLPYTGPTPTTGAGPSASSVPGTVAAPVKTGIPSAPDGEHVRLAELVGALDLGLVPRTLSPTVVFARPDTPDATAIIADPVAVPPPSTASRAYPTSHSYFATDAAGAATSSETPFRYDVLTLPPESVAYGPGQVPKLESEPRPLDPDAIRRDFPILREQVHGKRLVWLDNGATTQKPQAVIDRLSYFYEHENSNVHRGAHTLAARATDAYEAAREKVRRFLNAGSASEIIWVRGTTEGINLVAQSWGRQNVGEGDEIVITHLEHHANIVPWQQLVAQTGARLRVAPVDDNGQVILEEYERLLGSRTRLVAITAVSNALGTITPAHAMVAAAHRHGALALVDGAQAVSHMPVDVQSLDADFYVFSGHKVFAPTGIGAVYGKEAVLAATQPWQGGGNMIADVTFERTVFQDSTRPVRGGHRQYRGRGGVGGGDRLRLAHRYARHRGVRARAAGVRDGRSAKRARAAHHRHRAREGGRAVVRHRRTGPGRDRQGPRRRWHRRPGGAPLRAADPAPLRRGGHGACLAGALQHLRGHRHARGRAAQGPARPARLRGRFGHLGWRRCITLGRRCRGGSLVRAERHAQLVLHPAAQLLVDHRRTDERREVQLPVRRVEQERSGLRAAQAAMRADELLERRDLTGLGVVQADDRDVADVLDRVEALEAPPPRARRRPPAGPRPRPGRRPRKWMPFLPTATEPAVRGTHHQDADARMVGERLDQVGIQRVDLLERHALLAGVEVDEREVAAGDDDEVGRLGGLRATALAGPSTSSAPGWPSTGCGRRAPAG